MRIFQFDPLVPKEARGRAESPSPDRKAGEAPSFEAELRKAGRGSPGVVDKITSENLLASQGADLVDVDAAGSLLNSLVAGVYASSPESLRKVHNIDGILYYFQL